MRSKWGFRRQVPVALIAVVLGLIGVSGAFAANRTFTWNGSSSTAWNLAANWTPAGGSGTDFWPNQDGSGTDLVVIPFAASGRYPVLTSAVSPLVTLVSLQINQGGSLTLSASGTGNETQMLTVNGNLVVGTAAGTSAATLDCTGVTGYTTQGNIYLVLVTGNTTINTLGTIKTGDNTLQLSGAAGSLTLAGGTLDFSGAANTGTTTIGVGSIGGSGTINAGGLGSIRPQNNVNLTNIAYTPGQTRWTFAGTSTFTTGASSSTVASIRTGSSVIGSAGNVTIAAPAGGLTLTGNISGLGVISSGYAGSTLNVTNQTIYVGSAVAGQGDIDLSGAIYGGNAFSGFTSTGSTFIFTGTSSVASGGFSFNNVQVANGGSLTQADALTMTGNLTVGNGTSGSFTTGPNPYYSLTVGGGATINAGATFNANSSAIGITGGVTNSGTLNAGSSTISVGGNWNDTGGTFTAATSTVKLTSTTSQQVLGSTSFNNLSCTVAGATIQFGAGATQTITGTFTVTGTSAQMIKLISTSSGSQWFISAAASSIAYAWVQDSGVTGGSNIGTSTDNSHNNGNNTVPPTSPAWIFPSTGSFTWSGGTSTNWNVGANWSGGYVPNPGDSVTINSGTTYQPALTSNSTVANLTEGSGASINLSGYPLTISSSASLGGGTIGNGSATTATFSVGGATTLTNAVSISGAGNPISTTLTGGVSGAYGLTVAAGAGTVSFGSTAALSSLTVSSTNAAANAISLQAVTTSGAQSYTGKTTLAGTLAVSAAGSGVTVSGATTLAAGSGTITLTGSSAGNVVSMGTVDGAQALAITAGGGSVTLGAVGATTAVSSVTIGGTSAPTISLQAVRSTGGQSYTGGTTLAGNLTSTASGTIGVTGAVTLATGAITVQGAGAAGNNISFSSTVDGAQGLTVTAGAATASFGGAVGGTTALSSLTVSSTNAAANAISLQAVTTSGAQSYTGKTTLAGTLAVSAAGSGVTVSGATTLAAGSGTITLTGSSAGNVVSMGTVDGAQALAITAGGGSVTLGAVGATTAVSSVTIGGTSAPTISLQAVRSTGGQSYTGGTTLAGNLTSTASGTIGVTGAVTLATGAITVQGAGAAGNNISFSSTVDGAQGLTVTAGAATASFGGAVGGTTALSSLTVSSTNAAANAITIQSVTTTGIQDYAGHVTLGANTTIATTNSNVTFGGTIQSPTSYSLTVQKGTGTLTFGGTVGGGGNPLASLTIDAGGSVVMNGGGITTLTTVGGTQSYGAPMTLGADTTLTGYSGSFTGAISGAGYSLTLNFTTTSTINGTSFTSVNTFATGGPLQLSGTITTTGSQSYNGTVQLIGSATLTTTNSNVAFASTLDGSATGWSLTVSAGTAAASFASAVGATNALGAMSITANTLTFGGGAGSVHGNSTILLRPATAGTTVGVAGGAGTLPISSTDVSALAAGFSQIQIGQPLGTAAVTVGAAGVTFTSPVLLQSNGALGSVVLDGGVSAGANAVTVTAAAIDLNYAAGSGNAVTTTGGAIALNGPVTLTANTAVASGGGNITFSSTVNSQLATNYSLLLTAAAGAVSIGGAVGGTTPLSTVTVASASTIGLPAVTTSGAQSYTASTSTTLAGTLMVNTAGAGVAVSGPVVLAAGGGTITLTGTNAGNNVSFSGTSTVNGAQPLAITAGGGAVSFAAGAVVGGTTPLTTATIVTSATTSLQAVTTSGAQSYTATTGTTLAGTLTVNTAGAGVAVSGPVVLAAGGGTITLTGTNAGNNVSFSGTSTVNGAQPLAITAGGGAVSFAAGAAVGGTTPPTSVTVVTSATTSLRAVTTSGAQSFTATTGTTLNGNLISTTSGTIAVTGATTLATGAITVTGAGAAGDNISFSSTFDGSQALTVSAGAATVSFGGAIGGTTAVSSLSVTSTNAAATAITIQSVTTSLSQTYNGNVTLGAATTTLRTTNSSVSWSGAVNATSAGTQSLTLALGSGTATAGGSIGGATAIGSLTISSGVLSMGANSITLQGNWTNSAGATGFSAGSGTVSLVGGGAPTLVSGGSSFNNLSISGGTAVTVQTNPLSVTGQLTITTNADSINLQSLTFAIGTLSFGAAGNTGTFFLSGTQSGSSTIGSYAATAGLIELMGSTNASFPGTLPTTFYDLTINGQTAGTTYTLSNSIAVNNVLTLQGGILAASSSSLNITVASTWQNNVGTGGFSAGNGTVTFSGGTGSYAVNGNNDFYGFTCITAGATITFQPGSIQKVLPGGNFHITGSSGSYITLQATAAHTTGTYWNFDLQPGPPAATLTMAYVNVYDSNASANPISTPANVNVGTTPPTVYNDVDWYLTDLVTASQTADLDGDGKIDAIIVTVQAAVNGRLLGLPG